MYDDLQKNKSTSGSDIIYVKIQWVENKAK